MTEAVGLDRVRETARLAVTGSWPSASGAGRLFEAAGALLGLVTHNGWEGEAAVRLEAIARSWNGSADDWGVSIQRDGPRPTLPSVALLATAARRLLGGTPPAAVASEIHLNFCRLALDLTLRVADGWRGVVALGGGCLANRLLRHCLAEGLEDEGFLPLLATNVPPGDGGLSYGQAVLATVAASRDVELRGSLQSLD
jgi:hydrogenase maturation protein HypF